MSGRDSRPAAPGSIGRSPITFRFDDRAVSGFAGDTVASALLANGERAGFVSPIAGRPRGVFSAGVEEPNAFVEIEEPWFEPIRPATMVNVVDGFGCHDPRGRGRLADGAQRPTTGGASAIGTSRPS